MPFDTLEGLKKMSVKCALFFLFVKMANIDILSYNVGNEKKNIVIEINYVKKNIIIGGIRDARNMCLRSI